MTSGPVAGGGGGDPVPDESDEDCEAGSTGRTPRVPAPTGATKARIASPNPARAARGLLLELTGELAIRQNLLNFLGGWRGDSAEIENAGHKYSAQHKNR